MLKAIKLLCISAGLLLICACKKYAKEPTSVHFHLFNPVTNEPYVGVTVKIIQDEDVTPAFQLENEYESTVVWEGKTDANGKASAYFPVYKKDKFTYWHYVDQSFTADKKILKQPDYSPLEKEKSTELTYEVISYVSAIRWIKNTDCFDGSDKFKYRIKSLVNEYDTWSSWIPNTQSGYYEGCMDYFVYLNSQTQDVLDIEMEIIKNGVTTVQRDTFYIFGQNGTDTLKLFY